MKSSNSTLGEMHIYYDGNRPDMVTYNGATYRYVHSLQGDILGLQNGTGAFVVEYRYDAWGRLLSKTGSLAATLGTLNPFRYRGYVYDDEIGLYYLRSRYYNPNWCRFISADSILGHVGGLLQHNLWAYCLNKPVIYSDDNGDSATSNVLSAFVNSYEYRTTMPMKALIGAASNIFLAYYKKYEITNRYFNHFLFGGGTNIDANSVRGLKEALANSEDLAVSIRKAYTFDGVQVNSSVHFDTGDLHYAFGHVNYTARIRNEGGVLHVEGYISDTYNFGEWREYGGEYSSLSVTANNLGTLLEASGYGTEYSVIIPFEMEIPLY